jgi:Yos1-like
MPFSLYYFLEAALLCVNALAILHEDRFLRPRMYLLFGLPRDCALLRGVCSAVFSCSLRCVAFFFSLFSVYPRIGVCKVGGVAERSAHSSATVYSKEARTLCSTRTPARSTRHPHTLMFTLISFGSLRFRLLDTACSWLGGQQGRLQ